MKDGEQYIKADRSSVAVKIVTMVINFEDLFKNDKVLSDLGNSVVNENIGLLIEDIEPVIQRSLGKRHVLLFQVLYKKYLFLARQFLNSANQVLGKAPYNVLLP